MSCNILYEFRSANDRVVFRFISLSRSRSRMFRKILKLKSKTRCATLIVLKSQSFKWINLFRFLSLNKSAIFRKNISRDAFDVMSFNDYYCQQDVRDVCDDRRISLSKRLLFLVFFLDKLTSFLLTFISNLCLLLFYFLFANDALKTLFNSH